jgi:hypothetical protein
MSVPADFWAVADARYLGHHGAFLRDQAAQPEAYEWTPIALVNGAWQPFDQYHPVNQAKMRARLAAQRLARAGKAA